MHDYDMFLENGDLLENVELQCQLDEYMNEAHVATVGRIDSKKLNDKDYVENIISQIRLMNSSRQYISKNQVAIYNTMTGVLLVTNPLLPLPAKLASAAICLALIPAFNKINKAYYDKSAKKGFNDAIKCIDKCIASLEKENGNMSDADKKKVNKKISELKENKKNLESRLAELEKEKEK